jgi:hypothetical protein
LGKSLNPLMQLQGHRFRGLSELMFP